MEYVLETNALIKSYRGYTALCGLDMRVPRGAVYGLVGRNGAGKTTLIRIICGLQAPTGGGYTLYGVKNTDRAIRKSRRRIGAVALRQHRRDDCQPPFVRRDGELAQRQRLAQHQVGR